MVYNPPTRGATLEIPYLALITRVDPNFNREKLRQIEYVFSNRAFYGNPNIRGLYNRYANSYPVGQPNGGLDPAITGNLAPTVGNPSPGLYSGIPTGNWA